MTEHWVWLELKTKLERLASMFEFFWMFQNMFSQPSAPIIEYIERIFHMDLIDCELITV